MQILKSKLLTSMDDFITHEEHICIWERYPASMTEPEELTLISVNGLGENLCPPDLWRKAASEYPDNLVQADYDYEP
jgi:hypothetical protein